MAEGAAATSVLKAKDLFPYWPEVRSRLLDTIRRVSPRSLVYRPDSRALSLGEIFRHIAYVEEFWCYLLETGKPLLEESDHENWSDPSQIEHKLIGVHQRMEQILRNWSVEDLQKKRTNTMNGRQVDGIWMVWHCLEHEVHHGAQIDAYLDLLAGLPK